MTTWTLGRLFTAEEIDRAHALYDACDRSTFVDRCVEEVVGPVLSRVDGVTGQENDARYLAHMLGHVFGSVPSPKP